MGSPSSCGTNEPPPSCEPYENYPLPVSSAMVPPPGFSNPPPPTSSPVPFHQPGAGYYPVISQACGTPWPMPVPVTAAGYDNFVAGQPIVRTGSQHSLNDEAHAISIIENHHPQLMDPPHHCTPIEFYADPLTPPDSSSPQPQQPQLCFPGQPEMLYGPPPPHAPPQCSPFANKPRGEADFLKRGKYYSTLLHCMTLTTVHDMRVKGLEIAIIVSGSGGTQIV